MSKWTKTDTAFAVAVVFAVIITATMAAWSAGIIPAWDFPAAFRY